MSIATSEVSRALYNLCVESRKDPADTGHGKRPKVIIIAGPTACGKSDFAMMLAKHMGGEIISGDSMQVYRGLDIGTAKATQQDRLEVPHHLIDICDVTQPITVMDFYDVAVKAIQGVIERKAIPIVVGGSGFYLHALLYGPPAGPPPVPQVRQLLEAELEQDGAEALYDRLKTLDPEYAQGITRNDKHKIIRGLEIIAVTGQKVSSMPWKGRCPPHKFDFHCWFLHRPKDILYKRIEKRCHKMIEMGFLQEVEALEHQIRENSAASQAIGYRQALEYLASQRSQEDMDNFMRQFLQASRHYAKRQFTWFRREPLFRWLDVDILDFENAMELVMKDYERI
ncbi:MAG: tRNA (adenosine(37)-N6)-dimethylallyltransferase MiaA [Chlamydiales bacterium]|nr:tRNA (adenosine(37)-N6)-dimethylallyltransferase MiaA [Chlamydiales bacterium]